MKYLNHDDKTFIACVIITFIALAISALIVITAPRSSNAPAKKYYLHCVTSYVKAPLKECVYESSR